MLKNSKTHPNYGTVSNFQVFFFFFHIANLVGKKEKLDTGLSFACQYTRVAGFPL